MSIALDDKVVETIETVLLIDAQYRLFLLNDADVGKLLSFLSLVLLVIVFVQKYLFHP
jgi:hypothetical protein